jgi:sulfatase maturation enzyme AslB (radical SAM superfamily)
LGNIENDKIENILNSEKNTVIKQDLLNSVKTESCSSCWDTESLQNSVLGTSNRAHFKKIIGKVIPLTDFNSADTFNLRQIDMRWRNTCNLACVYCGSDLSSTWAKELNIETTVNEVELERTKKYIFDNIDNLKYVYLCGGEPLLMKENLELINLIQEKNPNIYIRVNTNLTNVNSPIYKLLLNCKNVHWILSVDSTKEIFEYVRFGATWESWVANLLQLKQDIENTEHKITFNMVWCSLTSLAIFDAIDLFQSFGFSSNSFIIQVIRGPDAFKIQYINQTTKELIKSMLVSRMADLPSSWLKTGYGMMLKELEIEYTGTNDPLKNIINELDHRRNLNGKSLFANLF